MNLYNVFTTFVIVLINILHSTDNRVHIALLDHPEYDTTYSISYILTPPSVPLAIDPSPPVLAPPFDLDFAPTPPHTFTGATSAGHWARNSSVDWEANLATVIFIALLVQAVNTFVLYTGNVSFNGVSFATQGSNPSSPTTVPTPTTLPAFPTFQTFPTFPTLPSSPSQPSTDVGYSPRSLVASPLFAALPNEDSDRDLSSYGIHTTTPPAPISGLIGGITNSMPSLLSMPSLHSSSSISDEEGDHQVATTSNGVSSVSLGLTARNFLDEITLALSPSPSFVTRTPPVVLNIPRNLWEELTDACHGGEPSFWDCYPQAAPRTPVDLDDEVIGGHNEDVENDAVEPLVHAWTIDAGESPAALDSAAQDVGPVGSTAESVEAPSRISRFTPTPAWKKSINALISGDRKTAARPVRALASATAVFVTDVAPASSSPSKPDAPKRVNWSEDTEQTLFTPPGDSVTGEKAGASDCRVFEKCDCALESAAFEPKSWNKFKIPASCHPRPPIHFLSPRDADKSNPSTRIAVDNVNAFRHHSTEPNVPYTNKDVEDLFYGAGAKSVRCFDGRVVGGAIRYNTSYAVVDFETVEDAKTAFKMFQGRKAYPGSYHLRLKFVDVNDRTFGRRMAASMGPMERSEEERRAFAESVEDADRVDVDLAKVVLPSRPGFTLPARPATPSEL